LHLFFIWNWWYHNFKFDFVVKFTIKHHIFFKCKKGMKPQSFYPSFFLFEKKYTNGWDHKVYISIHQFFLGKKCTFFWMRPQSFCFYPSFFFPQNLFKNGWNHNLSFYFYPSFVFLQILFKNGWNHNLSFCFYPSFFFPQNLFLKWMKPQVKFP